MLSTKNILLSSAIRNTTASSLLPAVANYALLSSTSGITKRYKHHKTQSQFAATDSITPLEPLPNKPIIDMAYDLHLPERSVLGKLPYHCEEPIVFVHGLFGSKRNYFADCKKIANALQTPVYTVDVRNHGLSEHALPFDYETITNDVLHFIEKHQLTGASKNKKVSIIGYSLGAKVAMMSLLKKPETFRSAVIIDNSPVVQPEITPFLKIFVKACVSTLQNGQIKANDKLWRHKASQAMRKLIPSPGIRGYLLNNVINKPPKTKEYKSPVINYNDGYIHFRNPVKHMSEIAVGNVADWPTKLVEGKQYLGPVCFLRGLKSDFILENGIKAINKYFPYNEIIGLNTTHFMLNERPNEYVRSIVDFFKSSRSALENKILADSKKGTVSIDIVSEGEQQLEGDKKEL
ncbi:uncharacterized protein SCODWIG_02181 [Saccharomycodes ludwigii]|uniref:AB hydrolase-1 domain-containing protein n=1 Tax=Saccharomycodes ludwigii TaxID=36035 RepID=A0A376B8G2_9ASCO|nr:hypothetical protein SCDLUD_002055 [Saccharomycodes ludwigii]KAH3902238.1 hypothetical protein SCDLUD_002055 [Saccharomycodes ludwigii]SSD60420.1 uncharacterized protein SCODWIG_02181 [Saccharomycodes ludwigii]